MNKIISYRIAYGQSLKELEKKVNMMIKKEYTPQGNIQFANTPESMIGEYSQRLYFQKMVKYEEIQKQ